MNKRLTEVRKGLKEALTKRARYLGGSWDVETIIKELKAEHAKNPNGINQSTYLQNKTADINNEIAVLKEAERERDIENVQDNINDNQDITNDKVTHFIRDTNQIEIDPGQENAPNVFVVTAKVHREMSSDTVVVPRQSGTSAERRPSEDLDAIISEKAPDRSISSEDETIV